MENVRKEDDDSKLEINSDDQGESEYDYYE